jgi:hypothetical protein
MAGMTAKAGKSGVLYSQSARSANDLTRRAGAGQVLPRKGQGGQKGAFRLSWLAFLHDPALDGTAALTH